MKRIDPRWWQIASLTGLLTWGVMVLRFDVTPVRITAIVSTALLTQLLCSLFTSTRFEWKSAMISALSLCLLMRSNSIFILLIGAVLAVSSKFILRVDGKHI